MNENIIFPKENGERTNKDYQVSFELLGEIMGNKQLSAQQYTSPLLHLQNKKEKSGKVGRDRYISTINQSQYLSSLALNTQKQTISKQKNQLKSHKQQHNSTHLNSSSSFTNFSHLRHHLQQITLPSQSLQLQNRLHQQSSYNHSSSHRFSAPYPSANISFVPFQQGSDVSQNNSQNFQTSSILFNRNERINPIPFQMNHYPYSSTAMEQEQDNQQDEIIESKEIQEELLDEQTCKYIELLKRGIEESPLSKGSPFISSSLQGIPQKRKILNLFNNEISEDMKNVFQLNNIIDKNNNIESMNSFILSTINDANEIMMQENTSSTNNIFTKGVIGSKRNPQQTAIQSHSPPQIIDTIELRQNMVEYDFYQNILDWSHTNKVAAMADNGMIHLTDFKNQINDEVLSNSIHVCNIDYLPHFLQLFSQPMSNLNSIQSLCLNSSTHFLSSQKKHNLSLGTFDFQQVLSSTSLQLPTQAGFSMNFLNMNKLESNESKIDNQEEIEEDRKVSQTFERSQFENTQANNKKEDIQNDDEQDDNTNISCFNLKTPSPNTHQNKVYQQSCHSSSSIFSIQPSVISPILPTNTTYYSILKFSPLGHILAAGRSDGIVEVYDLLKKQNIYVARVHSKLITSISINHSYIATASQDSKVVILDIRDLTHIIPAGFLSSKNSSSILSLEWNPISENTIAASTESGHINLYNLIKDSKYAYKEYYLRNSSIKTIAWNPFQRNILLAGSIDGYIFLIDLQKKYLIQRKNILNHIYKIIFSPNQKDRFVCLTGNQPETSNQQNNQQQFANPTPTNQETIQDNFGNQTGGMFVLSYPQINKIHQIQVGNKRICQGVLSYDYSTLYTYSKDNYLRQWKIFRESQLDSINSSILISTQELR